MVESTTDEYFVLYASHDVGGTTVEYPVRVVLGEDGTTTLSENVAPLPKDRYRVQKYSIEEPADVDGDCTDDITELGNLGPMNPVNAAPSIDLSDGVVALPDRETFEKLAYPDSGGTWHIKFVILDNDTDRPRVYFQNTRNALHHGPFLDSIGVDWRQEDAVSGIVILDPGLLAHNGSSGVYRFQSRRSYGGTYSFFERAYTLLAANVPFLADNLALWIRSEMLSSIQSDLPLYRSSRMNLVFDEDVYGDIDYMALNPGEGYGMLRSLDPDERPHSRDIVIYETLPNELPRVAGVMSTVPQTPLSHVNLRALQNGIPNAYIADALGDETISGLIDSHVYYAVTDTGYSIRAATQEEVDEHYASSRPAETQTPQRDLTVTSITPLSNIDFDDWDSFGVKAANVAVLRTLGFPEGTVPDGFAVPFYFYDEFMKHNNLYDYIEEMLADTDFQTDYDTKADKLKKLRKKIKKADTPDWIETALTEMHATFPEGTSLRYRSSTNNEDLPNFNGAGLYDSKTQRPEETEEDGISKSLKQVYASLWNFRAFVERDFHRIDHMAAAMGVLVHPNYSDEKVNGVAVSTDPAYGTKGTYYANSQVGEDLVTNPEAHSVPEEVLLNSDGTYSVVALSNKVSQGQLLMTDEQLGQLRQHLAQIHEKFDVLYGVEDGERFAIEIEFKIASDNILAIKQARPWVFTDPPPETGNKPHEVTGDALTAWLVTKPETHDGHPFIVHVRFSDSIDIVASDFRRRAAVVTGGRVTRVWRIDHRRDFWGIQVTPDSHSSNATLALAPNRPCTIGGAICTFDGRRLSNRLEHTVATAVVVARPNIPATGTPSISGTAQVGETLTADTSAIADGNGLDATEFSYQWLADSVDIQGATGNTYILVAADVGKAIKVRVSFTDDANNSETLTSATTTAVQPRPNSPATGAPTISGTAQVGETLTADVSGINDADGLTNVSYTYQWIATDGTTDTDIENATAATYILVTADQGKTIKAKVSFTDDANNGETLTSDATATVPATDEWWADMLVVDYGTGAIGAASADLFPNSGGNAGLQAKWLWYYSPERKLRLAFTDNVPNVNDLTLLVGDVALALQGGDATFSWEDVDVDWEDGQTLTARIVRDWTSAVVALNSPATGLPTIIGTAQAGETLTADVSGVNDADGLTSVSYSYQWVSNDGTTDTDIAGQTDSTYTLTDADAGKSIKVRVSFTDDADHEETLTSAATGVVAVKPNSPATGAPTIGGTAQAGETLTADVSGVNDADGLTNVSYSYQWISNDGTTDTDIQDATDSTYTLTDSDAGKSIKVRVSFTDDADHEETLTSAATGVVAAKPNSPATGAPTIGGTAQVGQTLTADVSSIADSDGLDDVSYSYQWIRSDNGTDADIGGQTASTYTLSDEDEDKAIKVRVSFTDDADHEETLTSAATGVVAGKPNSPATGAPTIGGTPQVGETLTADVSSIADSDGLTNVSYSYQWTAGGSDIDGATGSSYTLKDVQKGQTIQVRVSFRDDADNDETLTSDETATVAAKPTPLTVSGDFTLDAANDYPTGIWSDGTTMWVADFEDGKLYAYRMSDRSRDSGRDFTLDADNGSPVGIWSDGTTMWASDFTDGKLYAYRMSDRSRDSGKDFNTLFAAGNKFPEGIWSDGTTMWVADTGNDTVFAYDLSTRAWDFEKDITLGPGHNSPMGVWSNGSTMWVSDWRDTKLYAYRMSDRTWDSGKDFALDADDESYEGIWSAGSTMWVASRDDAKLYAYDWNNPATGAPTITGAVRVDETLAAGTRSIADADGLDAAIFEYQWVTRGGNADTDIAGATDSNYTIVPGDRGRTIKVRVSFTDGAGNRESMTSEPTGRVGAQGICDRTPSVMAAIVAGMTGVADCSEVSETRLRTWTGSRHFGPDVTPGLYLQGRGLSALQAGDFRELHALRALDLNRNFLETVPDGLFEDLRAVDELYLSGNFIDELPDGMFAGQTANLSVLDLSANRLERLSDGVLGNLDALVSLSVSGNGLSDLPAGLFDGLARLEVLDLSANSINELPDGVFDRNLQLRGLDLSINEISELPDGVFGGLADLQRLSLAGNDLKSLPEDVFADLGSLAELDLSGNKLKDLPVGVFEGLSGLTDLDAGDNPGAPFTFTAELERRGDDTVVVRLAEGATPFALKIELSARNGDLSAETVTIAAGGSYSDVVDVRPHGHLPVTVEIDSADFLLPSGGSASGVRADRGSAMLMWIGRPLVQREWIQNGPFALHPENADPKSIWSDGETLWVGDESARKVFAYKLWDDPGTAVSEYGTRDPGWDLPSLGDEDFYVTGHGPRLYVAEESLDGASRDVFGYDLTSFTRAEDRDFVYGGLNVAGGVFIVRGTATDGRHLWITNTTSHAHAFRLFDDPETPEDEYGRPDTSRKLTIPGRGQLRGLFTDGRTMWGVRFASNDASARSVKLSDGTEAGYDFPLHEDNDHASGIWSNGETFYVVDADDDMIYTYHGISGVVPPVVEDAETAAVLVGNTGQPGAAGHDLDSTGAKRAQAFTTGTSKAGYALASVGIEFGEVSDTSSAPTDIEVTLNADGSGDPGDALCTLIAPASLSERSVNTFVAPASGTTCPVLEKETTYFVVVERVRVTGSGAIAVGGTASGSEDTGAAEGWSIADGSVTYSPQAAAQGWASDAFSYKIEVRGSFINNPAAGEATVTGTAQVERTLVAAVSDVSDDDGLTGATYSYRWLRIDGATETNIGSGSPTYTLVAEDLGKRVKVRVAFVDDRGNYETLTSEATAAVEAFKAEDRPGTVSLFPARPRVGTVVSATLTDPDGLEGGGSGPAASLGAVSWSWARSPDGTTWTGVEAYGEGDSYVPTEEDEKMLLRAEASYTDGHGPGKSAQAVSTAVVGAREPGPELTVTVIVRGLSHPWGIDFTPDGTMLFTQRAGVLNARLTDGAVKQVDADLGDLLVDGFAGLQALAVDPDFTTNRRFYTLQGHTGREMQVIAWTIDANYDEATRVVDPLVEGIPIGPGPWHSGGRLVFGPEGYLWIATGDGRVVTGAQDLTSPGGKVLRVDPRTGAGAPGNPFGASSPVYSYGFRNPQGLALRPGTDQMWLVEHGPKHDDEINLLAPGDNYGWDPIPDDGTLVFYDYSDEAGVPMTDLAKFPSARQARWSSGFPTLATSGAVFLDGPQWGEWEGRLAVATLKTKSLRVFEFTEQGDLVSQIVVPELDGSHNRLRTPVLGPDGALYIATSNLPGNDRILRVTANHAATGAPSITGTLQVGETLTADASSVADSDGLTNVSYSHQWIRNEGNSDSDIPDATDTTYTLVADDVGKTIKVRVTFTDDAGNEETLTSAATEVVQQASNAWSATMTVGTRDGFTGYSYWGNPHLGSLSTTEIEWDGKTHYVRYIFLQDGDLRLGLNEEMFSTGFVLSIGDEEFGSADAMVDHGGASYRFRWDDPGLGWSDGDEVSVNLVQSDQNTPALGAPTISGTVRVDEMLTADTTDVEDADGLTNVSYSYQWMADGVDIQNATSSTHKLVFPDQGKTIKVKVSFTDDRDNAEALTSAATVAVVAAPNREATGEPTITGTTQVGETLTALTNGITDEDGLDDVSYSYQWISGGTDIDGATGSSYTLTNSEQGQTIQVRVTFTDDADHEETLTSAATGVVAAEPNSPAAGAPTIDGTAQVGETLTADTSEIADSDGLTNVTFSYQWLADDAEIAGATGSTYTLVDSDEGKAIEVRVTFTDDRNNEEIRTSTAMAAVAARPNTPATGLPTISGTAQVGETLTADITDIADEDGLTNVSYSYQWIWNDGNNDTDIAGETASTYTLLDDDVGKTIKVRVTFTDEANNEETLTSAVTGAVTAAANNPATGQPTISGTVRVGETLTADTSGIADDDGLDNVSYSYQWVANDGTTDMDIEDADDSTYTVSDDDVGKVINVRVSFTDDAGNQETLTSGPTVSISRSIIYVVEPTAHPTNLVAQWKNGSVRLSWYAPMLDTDSITGYRIYRDSQPIIYRLGSGTRYRDQDATEAGSEYTYCVSAVRDGADFSECSDDARVTVPGATTTVVSPDATDRHPTDLVVSLVDGVVVLTWDAPTMEAETVTGYEVLRRRPGNEEHTLVPYGQAIGGTTFIDHEATEPGVKYTYRVKALRGDEKSRWSNYVNITIPQ